MTAPKTYQPINERNNTLKHYKNKLNNDTFRTTHNKTDWLEIIVELLPYIVAIAGITTFMIMLNVVAEIIK